MYRFNKMSQGVFLALWGAGLATAAHAQEAATPVAPAPAVTPAVTTPAPEAAAAEPATTADAPAQAAAAKPEPQPATSAPRLSAVVVTGSRSTEVRTVDSSPAPIDVISSETLKEANQRNLLEALNTTLPSFNVPNLPGYGINAAVKGGQLRGLNSSHTLVLVNGKRRHVTARLGAGGFTASTPVDLGLIPTGSIESIEVLRDGASALYGSDAIAGVINIITRKDDEGGSVSAQYGEYAEGDGALTSYIARGGFKLGEGGHVHLSAQWDDQESAYRDSRVPDDIVFYFPQTAGGVPFLPSNPNGSGLKFSSLPAGSQRDPRDAQVDRDSVIFGASGGVPEATLGSLTADVGLPLTENSELYAFASYSSRETRSAQHFRFPWRNEVVRALYPDGFTPYTGVEEEDYELQLGVKGKEFFGWSWDLSTVYGADLMDSYQYNSNNPTFGLQSKRDFFTGSYEYSAWTNNADLRRSFEDGLFGVLTDVSLGGEYRRETYSRGPGEYQSWAHGGQTVLDGPNAGATFGEGGSQADVGISPVDAADNSRNNFAFYGGVSLYPTDKLIVDLAARYEDYSDFGDIVTGRVSGRYDFTPQFGVRGTVSTGFQAPSLAAQGYKATGATVTDITRTLDVNSSAAAALGAEPLKPEESTSLTLGLVFRPLDNLSIAIDGYQIEVRDRISQLSTLYARNLPTAQQPAFQGFLQSIGFNTGDGVSYFINAGDTKTLGLDFTLNSLIETGAGNFTLSAAANWNRTVLENRAPTPSELTSFGFSPSLTYSAASVTSIENLAPRFKGILDLGWDLNRWSAGINATSYGKLLRSNTVNVNGVSGLVVHDVGSLWLVNARAGVDITKHLRLDVNVNNVFNQEPGKLPPGTAVSSGNLWPFQTWSYVQNSPVNPAGTFYSGTLSYNW